MKHVDSITFAGAEAVVTFADGTCGSASGLMAAKWRNVIETLVDYETARRFERGEEVIDRVALALRGEHLE